MSKKAEGDAPAKQEAQPKEQKHDQKADKKPEEKKAAKGPEVVHSIAELKDALLKRIKKK